MDLRQRAAQIFATIAQGRPNGMPSFGGHMTEDQVWQLVAYVRSMSGQLRKDVAPSRGDDLQSPASRKGAASAQAEERTGRGAMKRLLPLPRC
jgi:hypothetical protein